MGILFERSNIAVIVKAGTLLVREESCPVVVGWSPRDRLLMSPEYAWLSHAHSTYIRLPVSNNELHEGLLRAAQPVERNSELHRLLTPVGAWLWSVGELRKDMMEQRQSAARFRIREMARFAAANWPGWYDLALASVARAEEQLDGEVEGLLGILDVPAVAIASAEAMRPLLEWVPPGMRAGSLEEMQDVLCYSSQGIGSATHEIQMAFNLCLQELAADLESSRTRLEQVRSAGFDPSEPVTSVLGSVGEALKKLEPSAQEPINRLAAIDLLVAALAKLRCHVEELRLRLSANLESVECI